MSWWRTAGFITKGMLNFTKSAAETAELSFVPGDLDVSLEGKVAVVTGSADVQSNPIQCLHVFLQFEFRNRL